VTPAGALVLRLPAVARRDKSESNPILTWPMLALGLDCFRVTQFRLASQRFITIPDRQQKILQSGKPVAAKITAALELSELSTIRLDKNPDNSILLANSMINAIND